MKRIPLLQSDLHLMLHGLYPCTTNYSSNCINVDVLETQKDYFVFFHKFCSMF